MTHRWVPSADADPARTSPTRRPYPSAHGSPTRAWSVSPGRSGRGGGGGGVLPSAWDCGLCSHGAAGLSPSAAPSPRVPLAVPTPLFGHRLGLGPYLSAGVAFPAKGAPSGLASPPRLTHHWPA